MSPLLLSVAHHHHTTSRSDLYDSRRTRTTATTTVNGDNKSTSSFDDDNTIDDELFQPLVISMNHDDNIKAHPYYDNDGCAQKEEETDAEFNNAVNEENQRMEENFIPPPPSWFRPETTTTTTTNTAEWTFDNNKTMELSTYRPDSVNEYDDDDDNDTSSPPPTPSKPHLPLQQSIPIAAREILQTAFDRSLHYSLLFYSTRGKRSYRHSDLGSVGGYPPSLISLEGVGEEEQRGAVSLPPFSSLSWSDRQLVTEWRSISLGRPPSSSSNLDDDADDFDRARVLLPRPMEPPLWKNDVRCFECRRLFGAGVLLRHHCRLCGESFCAEHSGFGHCLPHLGYDPEVSERVCGGCKTILTQRELAERVAWRMARCRDYFDKNLTPYFETGVDTMEDAALRIAQYTIKLTRQIPLGAQATVAIETLEVLRSHGLKGIYALVLRKDFMAAADLLCKVAGINERSWPLSFHELSASVFYALAQHRWLRGVDPNREEWCHKIMEVESGVVGMVDRERGKRGELVVDETDTCPMVESVVDLLAMADYAIHEAMHERSSHPANDLISDRPSTSASDEDINDDNLFGPFMSANQPHQPIHHPGTSPSVPVCTPLPTSTLCSLLFYAPLALEFIYVRNEVDMQLLAAQQGWSLLYAHLKQVMADDRPASALFVHERQKIACFAVRGTATVQDVVTDIRALPVPFPESSRRQNDNGWDILENPPGLALCGMVRAATQLFEENEGVLMEFVRRGYRIRIVGHSLGGGVAALLGILTKRALERKGWWRDGTAKRRGGRKEGEGEGGEEFEESDLLRVYAYGTPACIDSKLADGTTSFVTSVVLHDDVVPRLTPTSIRKLVKHLLYVRETWVKTHLNRDMNDVVKRVRRGWAPRWRGSFVLLGKKGKEKEETDGQDEDGGKKGVMVKDGKIIRGRGGREGGDNEEEGEAETIDGDFFYEAEENLIESDDEDDELGNTCRKKSLQPIHEEDEWDVPFDEPAIMTDSSNNNTPIPNGVLLEETPLPRMFIPGKIAHIYTHNGGYKATYVPRTFRELRRVSLAVNMLTDHKTTHYYQALLEVKSIRKASTPLPEWIGFTSSNTCSNCASKFTWASTCDSEAQEARDKHNCRSCGSLVCGPCSSNNVPLPKCGINVPVRICDSCYHDMGEVLRGDGGEDEMMRSFVDEEEEMSDMESEEENNMGGGDEGERVGRVRSGGGGKEKSMVNELARKIYYSLANYEGHY